jgi:site-specific DNA-methyltransferase (adenine-specific)
MEFMRSCKDNQFDLAVVDPPYGIGASSVSFINGTSKSKKPYYKEKCWDKETPNKYYFHELKRVSKNQIVWGGNYFADLLGSFRCFICWDKTIHGNSYADCELAWTSFDSVARYYRKNIAQVNSEGRMHPTQKPITLYDFVFSEFAKPGDTILDTHMGSQSSRISAHKAGLDFTGCELDPEYFEQGNERFHKYLLKSGTAEPDKAMPGQQINIF